MDEEDPRHAEKKTIINIDRTEEATEDTYTWFVGYIQCQVQMTNRLILSQHHSLISVLKRLLPPPYTGIKCFPCPYNHTLIRRCLTLLYLNFLVLEIFRQIGHLPYSFCSFEVSLEGFLCSRVLVGVCDGFVRTVLETRT